MQIKRLRRLRRNEAIRGLVAETRLSPEALVMPYFAVSGKNKKEPVESIPGIFRLSVDNIVKDIAESGIKSVLLFGLSDKKDISGAYKKNGITQKTVSFLRKEFKDLVIFTDVCLCGFNPTGHCWVGDNDNTIKILAKIALSHAEAGCDFVSPSAMMDGQVFAIREILDKNGFTDTGILAYSAKYASSFYGPFRDILDSAPRFGDRKNYQLDYRNVNEALREVEQDIKEGADIVMVKPALAYLDIIYRVKQEFNIPVAAYNVSGEYSLIRERDMILETVTAIKRAGADIIITYHAKEIIQYCKKIYSRRGE